jgi:hypothetical protein
MNAKFKEIVESLHPKFLELMAMDPVTIDKVPADAGLKGGGVYLFSVGAENLYAGRTKRSIRTRLRYHVSSAADCPFAWRLARERTGKPSAYKSVGSRKDLLGDAAFEAAYQQAKQKIRAMDVRYVAEADPLRQALLEIYVAVAAGAKHNDFDTH